MEKAIGDFFYILILIITSVSTVILIAEASGFLPSSWSKHLIKNKLGLTREVLKDLGLNLNETKKAISNCLTTESLKRIEDKLKVISYPIEVEIGETSRGYFFKQYIDLMGATTKESNARDFAGLLKTYVEKSGCIDLSEIDIIVTSKLGSPILGYEFAKNLEKPLILHSSEDKFRTSNSEYDLQKKFDTGGCNNLHRKKALIVEDSTTGGRKIIKAIQDLRKNGVIVEECLVIFAPQGKNAKEKLSEVGVTLHCIIETHKEDEA